MGSLSTHHMGHSEYSHGVCGAPAPPRTRRSRWRPCLGRRGRTAGVGSPLGGRGCIHTRASSASTTRQLTQGDGGSGCRTYKLLSRRGIARSDGGTRPTSRFPETSLQPERADVCSPTGVFAPPKAGDLGMWEGRLEGTYRYLSAVSAEIVDGTVPLKRFSPSILCHSALSHTRSAMALRGRGGVQPDELG